MKRMPRTGRLASAILGSLAWAAANGADGDAALTDLQQRIDRLDGGTQCAESPPLSAEQPLPPDRPLRGVVDPPFPKVVDMAFHYPNPVTGRAPPVLLH